MSDKKKKSESRTRRYRHGAESAATDGVHRTEAAAAAPSSGSSSGGGVNGAHTHHHKSKKASRRPTGSKAKGASAAGSKAGSGSNTTSPRGRAVGDDAVLLRPEGTVEELQSQLEEAILRLHVLERQRASAQHALLDVDIGPQERAELRGVLDELKREAEKLSQKKFTLEQRMTESGLELPAPTMRIVDHGGLLEVDDGVELDTSSDVTDDAESSDHHARLRRVKSDEQVRGGGGKLSLSQSSPSVIKKSLLGSSLKVRKENMMAKGYADRASSPQLITRSGSPSSYSRPEGQAPMPPSLQDDGSEQQSSSSSSSNSSNV
jgi:hypothetical protein